MNMVLYQTHGANIRCVIIFIEKHYIFENIMV